MANVSVTETESALSGPNQTEVASGSVAGISGQVHYRFLTTGRYAWYGQATFPLMASEGTYLSAGGGIEYYWGTPARSVLKDLTTSFVLTPRMRYFLSGGINLGYIAYNTETAKKNDTLIEIELGGGMSYKFNKWTLRASAGIARGTGIATTTMGMKAMVGGIFFLD
jgi:hypothetical protein